MLGTAATRRPGVVRDAHARVVSVGLSWLTILRKGEGFHRAFADWDVERIAAYGERDVKRLLSDVAIVRHRAKIEAAIASARATVDLRADRESLDGLLWRFAPPDGAKPPATGHDIPPATPELTAMAKELKRRRFRFGGPTTAYALMEAVGLVNDHLAGCEFRVPAGDMGAGEPAD